MLSADLLGNLIIAQFFLSVLGRIGGVWTFSIFLALAVVSFGYVAAFAPETKGRPLEAIRRYWENGGRWPAEDREPSRRPVTSGS